MKRARPASRPSGRWISLIVSLSLLVSCLALVPFDTAFGKRSIPFLKAQGQQNGSANGQARRVPPITPQPGPPAANLPNLDELKNRRTEEPRPRVMHLRLETGERGIGAESEDDQLVAVDHAGRQERE